MIKLNASYSKKVPAEQEYSSKSFLACIEVELPTGASAKECKVKYMIPSSSLGGL